MVNERFSKLATLSNQILSTFSALQGNDGDPAEAGEELEGRPHRGNAIAQLFASTGRLVSTRDLMKWCTRIVAFMERQNVAPPLAAALVSAELKDLIFCEAVACFCGMMATDKQRSTVMEVIAASWNISNDRVKYYLEMQKPTVHTEGETISFGRSTLWKKGARGANRDDSRQKKKKPKFAHTLHSVRLLEEIGVAVSLHEPVLLVGETGTGKTSVVQYMAHLLGHNLVVQNLSQQSDSTDLLGGFKPVELQLLCLPLKNEFQKLFEKTWSSKANREFLDRVAVEYSMKNWKTLLHLMLVSCEKVEKMDQEGRKGMEPGETADSGELRAKRGLPPNLRRRWKKLTASVRKLKTQVDQGLAPGGGQGGGFAFAFIEGALVKAVRRGHWVLLDEINLASTDTLESLSGLLEGGGLYLTERGDITAVERHKDFRIFACMNPPTDVGKKELPPGLRNRFTEFYVRGISARTDLAMVVQEYLSGLSCAFPPLKPLSFLLPSLPSSLFTLRLRLHLN